jgi:hypothetical protein
VVAYVFQKIAKAGKVAGVDSFAPTKAREWYRNTAKSLGDVSPSKLIADKDSLTSTLSIGKMYLFHYDPKHKKTLPYYDTFPLIFPIEMYSDGFLGINLHYISPLLRAKLMDALYTTINNKNNNDTTRLQLSYEILKSASQFRLFQPCLKRYLFSHVKSRYFYIPPNQWDVSIMLPTERFVGAEKSRVFKESQRR